MRPVLFFIPEEIAGVPVFGFGWLLAIWAACSIGLLAWLIRTRGFNAETRSYLPSILISGLAIALVLPRLLDDSGLPIRGYGVMLLIAFTSAVALTIRRARRAGLDPEVIFSLGFWLFVAGIVGARAAYVVQFWRDFQKVDEFHVPTGFPDFAKIVNIAQGGLTVYGSLLAGGLALFVFLRKYRLPGLALADLVAPGVLLGMGLGRIGCFFTGCCYGDTCQLPWSVTFPWGTPPHIEQALDGQLHLEGLTFRDLDKRAAAPPIIAGVEPNSPAARNGLKAGNCIRGVLLPSRDGTKTVEVATAEGAIHALEQLRDGQQVALRVEGRPDVVAWTLSHPARSLQVHPAQIYSAIDSLLLCLFLLAYSPFCRRDGELTALTLTLHPISRFLLEMVRTEPKVFNSPLSIAQIISLGLLLGGVVLWFYLRGRTSRAAWPEAVAIRPRVTSGVAATV